MLLCFGISRLPQSDDLYRMQSARMRFKRYSRREPVKPTTNFASSLTVSIRAPTAGRMDFAPISETPVERESKTLRSRSTLQKRAVRAPPLRPFQTRRTRSAREKSCVLKLAAPWGTPDLAGCMATSSQLVHLNIEGQMYGRSVSRHSADRPILSFSS